jgi:hypothetical protein
MHTIDNGMDLYSILRMIENHDPETSANTALVITGNQMQKILDGKHGDDFLNFATELESVIVCRATKRVGKYHFCPKKLSFKKCCFLKFCHEVLISASQLSPGLKFFVTILHQTLTRFSSCQN